MIKILKDGTKDKKYFGKCGKCATEFEYEHSDVKYEKSPVSTAETRILTCPVCGETIFVNLLTKEEVDELGKNSRYGYSNCCIC